MAYQFEKSGALKKMTAEELAAADKDSAVIVRNTGILEDGSHYWAFIAVKPSKYQDFMRATVERRLITFEDYGYFLKYGFEAEVPASVQAEIKQQYGWDDNYMATLAQDVRKAQITFLQAQEASQMNDIVAMLKKKQTGGA